MFQIISILRNLVKRALASWKNRLKYSSDWKSRLINDASLKYERAI